MSNAKIINPTFSESKDHNACELAELQCKSLTTAFFHKNDGKLRLNVALLVQKLLSGKRIKLELHQKLTLHFSSSSPNELLDDALFAALI